MKNKQIYTYPLESDGNLMAFYRLTFEPNYFITVHLYVFPQYLHCFNAVCAKFELFYKANHPKIMETEFFNYECLNLSPYEIEFYTRKFNYNTNNKKLNP